MRNVLSILLLCGFGSSLCLAELDENQDFKSGLDALNSHLPEVAVLKFRAALSSEDCTTDEKRELLYRLAEAQVRAVKGTDAEETLASPELGDSVKTNFWKAQALFAQGRHEEAAIAFEKIAVSEESEFRSLSLLALSELYRSLRKPEKAFEVLMKAADTRKLSQAVNLKLVELYLEKDLLVEAENLVNEIQPKGGNDENVKQFLTARILLEKGESEKSSDIFSLLKESENLNAVLSFAALLGYVDSQFKEQNWEQGIDELVQLIENEPQSSYIHLAFNRLRIVLGEEFDNTALISSLDQWIEPAPIANLDEELEADDEEAFEFTYPDRDAFSRFVRALILADSEDSENLEKSNILLNSLREHHPEHFLSTVSWMQTAVNQIKSEKLEQALVALKKMQEAGLTKELKAKAIAMQAMLLAEESRTFQAVEELNNEGEYSTHSFTKFRCSSI